MYVSQRRIPTQSFWVLLLLSLLRVDPASASDGFPGISSTGTLRISVTVPERFDIRALEPGTFRIGRYSAINSPYRYRVSARGTGPTSAFSITGKNRQDVSFRVFFRDGKEGAEVELLPKRQALIQGQTLKGQRDLLGTYEVKMPENIPEKDLDSYSGALSFVFTCQ